MERINYPFEPGNIGIHFEEVFKNYTQGKIRGIITSGSGASINYKVAKDELYVEDFAFADRFMHARAEGEVAKFSLQTKTSPLDVIITRGFPWQRHPDMFAKKFVGVALEYFKSNGIEITICKAVWYLNSDNHKAYTQELAIDNDKVRAAKATPSGQIFVSYGYNRINLEDISDSNLFNRHTVRAFFHRPA